MQKMIEARSPPLRARKWQGPPGAPRPLRGRRALRLVSVLEKDPKLSAERTQGNPQRHDHQPLEEQIVEPNLPLRQLPLKRLTCEEGQAFVFSYGALMAYGRIRSKIDRVHQRMPCTVVDEDIQLCFRHRGGYATLLKGGEPVNKSFLPQVHGVLYLVDKADLKKLQKGEGGYLLENVEVATYDGWSATAKAFVSSPWALLPTEVAPTEKYMKTLRTGAADNFLDPLWQAYLSSIPTVTSVGLGPAYYNTPSKYLAYGFLCIVALLVAGFFAQH